MAHKKKAHMKKHEDEHHHEHEEHHHGKKKHKDVTHRMERSIATKAKHAGRHK